MSGQTRISQEYVIVGGGISGLFLALALKRIVGIKPVVYEQAVEYLEDCGGAIGLYPNGLKTIAWVAPELVETLRGLGVPYKKRKWYRSDGTLVCEGDESKFGEPGSLGIRRWRFQYDEKA